MTAAKRVLITGANGLLGHHALAAWSGRHEVHAIVRSEPERREPDVIYHLIDLGTDWDAASLPTKIDTVLHLAQSTRMRDFPSAALDIFRVNTQAAALLLDYAHRAGATQFVLASSGGLYAPSSDPLTEASRLDPPRGPLAYYFEAKRSAENLAADYAELMHVSILRPFFIYGSGQREGMLIPRLIGNVRCGLPIGVAGGMGTRLNPVYAADAVRALDACLAASAGMVINVAGPDIVSIRDIANHIGGVIGRMPVFEITAGAPDVIVADISRLKGLIGTEMTGIWSGLARMIAP